jgi:hypothetical protein
MEKCASSKTDDINTLQSFLQLHLKFFTFGDYLPRSLMESGI